MIKIFTLNSNGKIEITEEELRKLLDDSYWEGYYSANRFWTYTSPSVTNPITNPSITWSSDRTTVTAEALNGDCNAK